ncbi:hypothetical protein EV189_0852 [Motilibacter rhizosphaerae]|uniref:Uncharacterized protein n=1 Tax=Motilibacter rhizosphaerae TaxID=598652 RepID=A0A4Q7NWK8_9ACTN|nr:hypothetical protein EV189_0852 [Motilibacter rhizosphaerae]
MVPSPEDLVLDAAAGGSDARPRAGVSTRAVWPRTAFAVVEVRGTFSRWAAGVWFQRGRCGRPEASPQFPSAIAAQGPVGEDAEVEYAQSYTCDPKDSTLPRHLGDLLIDAGSGFTHVEPLGGQPTKPASQHTYSYVVPGQGHRLGFRVRDVNAADNYGQLQLFVRSAVGGDCRAGGWRAFSSYSSESQCRADLGAGRAPLPPGATVRFTSFPRTARSGAAVAAQATVRGTAVPVSSAVVGLWRQQGRRWVRVAAARPTAAGRVTVRFTARATATYAFRIDGVRASSSSRTLRVVHPRR